MCAGRHTHLLLVDGVVGTPSHLIALGGELEENRLHIDGFRHVNFVHGEGAGGVQLLARDAPRTVTGPLKRLGFAKGRRLDFRKSQFH